MPHVGKGLVLHVARVPGGYGAVFLPTPVMIYSCTSVRDANLGHLFMRAFGAGTFADVQSLRREPHDAEESCWLHASEFCLSTAPVTVSPSE